MPWSRAVGSVTTALSLAALALLVGGCDRLRSLTGDPVGARPDASSFAPMPRPGSATAPPSSSALARDPHESRRGACHRGDCDLTRELCCENPSTGEEKCVPRDAAPPPAKGKRVMCSADGAWRIAMECAGASDCGGDARCCIEQPSPGFRQTTCEVTCAAEESCAGNESSACGAPGSRCLALPGSRGGGHCVPGAGADGGAPCAPCFGKNSIDQCVPLCADDQRCEDAGCVDE